MLETAAKLIVYASALINALKLKKKKTKNQAFQSLFAFASSFDV